MWGLTTLSLSPSHCEGVLDIWDNNKQESPVSTVLTIVGFFCPFSGLFPTNDHVNHRDSRPSQFDIFDHLFTFKVPLSNVILDRRYHGNQELYRLIVTFNSISYNAYKTYFLSDVNIVITLIYKSPLRKPGDALNRSHNSFTDSNHRRI